MNKQDFINEGFYFDHGQYEVEIGSVMEDSKGYYYLVAYDERNDNVVLQMKWDGSPSQIIEITPETRTSLEEYFTPLDASRVPVFEPLF